MPTFPEDAAFAVPNSSISRRTPSKKDTARGVKGPPLRVAPFVLRPMFDGLATALRARSSIEPEASEKSRSPRSA